MAFFFRVGARGHVSGASAQSWGPGARDREFSAGCRGGFFLGLGVLFRVGEMFAQNFFFQICFRVGGLGHVQGAVLGLSWAVLGVS